MSESLSVILHVAKKGGEEAEKRRQRDMASLITQLRLYRFLTIYLGP